jgi:hypothetical protein
MDIFEENCLLMAFRNCGVRNKKALDDPARISKEFTHVNSKKINEMLFFM